MKKLFPIVFLFFVTKVFATENVVQFTFSQSTVPFQINVLSGELSGLVTDLPSGSCIYNMDFKGKNETSSIFQYERKDLDKGVNYYQKIEINLLSKKAYVFTSKRNKINAIDLEIKSCTASQCLNFSNLPKCSY